MSEKVRKSLQQKSFIRQAEAGVVCVYKWEIQLALPALSRDTRELCHDRFSLIFLFFFIFFFILLFSISFPYLFRIFSVSEWNFRKLVCQITVGMPLHDEVFASSKKKRIALKKWRIFFFEQISSHVNNYIFSVMKFFKIKVYKRNRMQLCCVNTSSFEFIFILFFVINILLV